MFDTLTFNRTLRVVECADCHEIFGISMDYESSGDQFVCPHGHRQHFVETEKVRLKKQLEEKELTILSLRDQVDTARVERDRESRRFRATKGHLTKVRNRIAKGVCPVCNRYFDNLHRHMESKHKPKGKDK